METTRSPFLGVINIIRFNWHFYLVALVGLGIVSFLLPFLPGPLYTIAKWGSILGVVSLLITLMVSCYVYDASDLYQLNFLPTSSLKSILNIHAGFDEISPILKSKFPNGKLTICDFFNPELHTEVSIKRARKAYPPSANTIKVETNSLPFADNSFDIIVAFLSAHEIRDEKERVTFFRELKRVSTPEGQIIVTEHLRDLPNFLAYNMGFFHFHAKSVWENTFKQAGLRLGEEIKTTPFISTFILSHHGNTP
ncbi:MAG: class I SAM-dependent methyltransferase [Bacteroidota bacterium]